MAQQVRERSAASCGDCMAAPIAGNGEFTEDSGIIDVANPGDVDGPGASAVFYGPQRPTADEDGNVFVYDTGNFKIKRIAADADRTVTTLTQLDEGGTPLAMTAMKGEIGYPSALTAKTWGFYDVLFKGREFRFQRPYTSYVIENVLFKIAYPTAFHGQSAVEAAINLHPLVKDRLDEIERIDVRCHNSSMVILDKTGPLHNFADRDHCMQYMIAIGLIFGQLTAEDYEDHVAADPRIDALRAKMHLSEDERYERDYHDPEKRSNANSIQVRFKDGSKSPLSEVEYPLGHRRRRKEGVPELMRKFETNVARVFAPRQRDRILATCTDRKTVESMAVHEFVDLLTRN